MYGKSFNASPIALNVSPDWFATNKRLKNVIMFCSLMMAF